MKLQHHITAIAIGALAATQSNALDEHAAAAEEMARYAHSQFADWISVPEVLDAIRVQNMENGRLSQDRIVQLDDQWRAEFDTFTRPMMAELLARPVSRYLAQQVIDEKGKVTEVIIMDMHGLNVAQTAATSDLWQGDEEKYTQTYLSSADTPHVSEIEQGEASNIYQRQISVKIVDPLTGQAIGAATISVNAEYFY